MTGAGRGLARATAVLVLLLAARSHDVGASTARSPDTLPGRLTDAAFWKLVSDISEPGGYFRIEDNFTSNEPEIGQLFSALRATHVEGGVYLGVGPEQNYTYIAAVRPRMAFIVDIRRQAVVQHLMYKAMFEMAKDRADFISLLFAKPRPAGLDTTTAVERLWDAYARVVRDTALRSRNFVRVVERLTRVHHFALTADEAARLKWVFDAFQVYGPDITTRGPRSARGGRATFATLTASRDALGAANSFLSSEDNYRYVKSLHDRNLIVPVSGDFAGPKALRAIGAYVKAHGATLRAFYVSNVEQYLFQDHKERAFYENVATLPVDARSVFIRPGTMRRGSPGPTRPLCPIAELLRGARGARGYSYVDARSCASVRSSR